MAYMSQEEKKAKTPAIKAVLKKYGMKGSISVRNHSTLIVTVSKGIIDFGDDKLQINTYWIEKHFNELPIAQKFLMELKDAMMTGNYNNSDVMTDYFDVGFYIDINIGKWNKPYILEA